MKRNVILLVDADVETCAAALTASETVGFDVRFAKIHRHFSEISELGLDDVAAIVLDYDPDTHGLDIVETLDRWLPSRPIVIVSRSEHLQQSIIMAGAGTKNLIKPVTAAQLAAAIQAVMHEPGCRCPTCDLWGHPLIGKTNEEFAT